MYWTQGGPGYIGRATLATPPSVNLTLLVGLDDPEVMAADGSHIYWSTGLGNIGRANVDASGAVSGVTESFIFGAFAKGLAVEGGYIYWTTSLGGNRIMRASLDDPSTHQSVTSTAVAAAGVAVDGVSGHIYWANTGLNTIGGANLDATGAVSGVSQTLITGAAKPQGVAVNDTAVDKHVYWTNTSSGFIGRADLNGSGSSVNQDFIFAGSPQAIAVDNAHVWWSNGQPFYAIGRADLDGSSASVNQRFIGTLSTPTGIAVDTLITPGPGPGAGPPPTIRGLTDDVQQAGLPPGRQRGLLAKLDVAQRSLDAGNLPAACATLGAFGNELSAQSGKRLDAGETAGLIADATAIRRLLGCGGD